MRCSDLSLLLAALAAALAPMGAWADARRGETLFRSYCAVCHGSPLGQGGDAIAAGAGRPDVIANAFRTRAEMAAFQSFFETGDLVDLAEYLAERYGVGVPPPQPSATVPAVEFYNANLDHYFVSAIPAEIAVLDAGTTIRGWVRTNAVFQVWASAAAAPPEASPVCRFYIPPAFGDSHFYSASPAECAEVRERFPQFDFEAPEVMAVRLPDLVTGACAAGTVPVYRLWNRRADTNHRYVTDRTVRQAMIDRGHVPEGYGPDGVAFCAPTASAGAQ